MTTPMRPPLPSDPDAPVSEEELREAEALRHALEDASIESEAASLARAVVLAHAPRPLTDEENQALVAAALRAPAVAVRARGGARGVRWVGAGMGAMALAAAVLMMLRPQSDAVATRPIPLREARSTAPLFDAPFADHGAGSRRIDRIASARAKDLRENRFARWSAR